MHGARRRASGAIVGAITAVVTVALIDLAESTAINFLCCEERIG
jgi:hypothetical protein